MASPVESDPIHREYSGNSEQTATLVASETLSNTGDSRASPELKSEDTFPNIFEISKEAATHIPCSGADESVAPISEEVALQDAENQRLLKEAGDLFRQRLAINPSAPSAAQTTNEIDSDAEDAVVAARFESYKKSYDRKKKKGQNTVEDDIAFSKARNAEEGRLKLNSRKRAYEDLNPEIMVAEEDALFFDEGASDDVSTAVQAIEVDTPVSKRYKASRSNRVPDSALQDAMNIGRDALEMESRKAASKKRQPKLSAKKREPKASGTRGSRSKDKKKAEGVSKPKRGRPPKGPQMTSLQTLFSNDIVSAAQANAGKEAQPGFTSRVKKDALAELIASIPEAERSTHNADKNALDRATKSFSGHATMKADGNNGWRLRGMKTSLYHYQLLGAAFMRDRENSRTRPYGGLQSDEMGLGKTVTCLANIIDGKGSPNSPNRTTLIVCPPGLCSQWLSEIRKHVLPETLQETIIYRAGARIESADPARTLSNSDIIITSYNEVMRSYPHCVPPTHLITPEAKTKWWIEHFKTKRGVLHRIFFRRIVLDEAQAIKNHSSKTSIAIRSLSGKYRWAISGTPVQNNLGEFFPFFSFLKVPNTGNIDTFKNNFAGRNDISNLRLQTLLRQIMIRRTHLDKMFGRPLLQLPGITTKTIKVDFNECEKAIYKIVKARFIAKIRTYANAGDLDKKFQSIFVLYLRLRQLVGHILLIQETLKDLMESEDLEKLWRLTESEVQPQGEGGGLAVLSQLRKMLSKTEDAQTIAGSDETQQDLNHLARDGVQANEGDEDESGGTFGVAFRFRKYLRSLKDTGQWELMNKRSLCHKCGGVPDNPHITSCFHVYCKECLQDMLYTAAQAEKDRARCIACDAEFEHTEACHGFDQATANLTSSPSRRADRQPRKSTEGEEDIDWITVGGTILPSAKTLAVKAQIQNWVEEDPEAKIIIFTQFRSMIKILARMMQEEKWGWSQFHGSMSFTARDKALVDFAEKPQTKVLLASLKAGGVGLNLTMASKVIILDLWWNESVEQQAFCRCFRIGQNRPVDICRIVVRDSIDEDILAMQERKTTEIDMAMAAKNRPGKMSTRELIRLFGPIDLAEGADGQAAATAAEPFIFVEDEDDDDDNSDSGVPTRVPMPPFA